MAIGSAPEIGVFFSRFGAMTVEQQTQWLASMPKMFGRDLMRGYGTVAYPPRFPAGDLPERYSDSIFSDS